MHDKLLIWDCKAPPPPPDQDKVILWQSFVVSDNRTEFSIPKLVEDNSDKYRAKYLALIYDLGVKDLTSGSGVSVIDYLNIRNDFSYWWMTLLAEKSNYFKSPQIEDVIKLLAFQEWVKDKTFTSVSVVSGDKRLIASIKLLFPKTKVRLLHSRTNKFTIKNVYNQLPLLVQSLIWLIRFLFEHWPLRGVGVNQWHNSQGKFLFVSYFDNLTSDSIKTGNYESNYWDKLPDLLDENGIHSNWLHIYVKNTAIKTAKEARAIIDNYNLKSNEQVHTTLQSFIDIRIILRTLRDWCYLLKKRKKLENVLKKESGFLWPLLEEDFLISMVGPTAINNLIYIGLFEKVFAKLPKQKTGFYLQENQEWESAFIYAWKTLQYKNQLIGIPHSTIRYWDLRYFFDNRFFSKKQKKLNAPFPDKVGLNGPAAKINLLESGYPEDQTIDLEALRYLHLLEESNFRENSKIKHNKVVLVLGDYLREDTNLQMELLIESLKFLDQSLKFIIKPHPNCPINIDDFPKLNFRVSDQSINLLLDKCSIVYTSSVTSASVDAYCANKYVITALNPKRLNPSPLRGYSDIVFVSTTTELIDAFDKFDKLVKNHHREGKDYFYLNSNLLRWKKLLKI